MNPGSAADPLMNTLYFVIFKTPHEFVQHAFLGGHFAGKENKLSEVLAKAVKSCAHTPPHALADKRLKTLKFWLQRARELSQEEMQFKSELHPEQRQILAPKRLLLWKEMMKSYGYPGVNAFNKVVEGAQLTGQAPYVPHFEACCKPAKLSELELARGAASSREGLLHSIGSSIRSSGDRKSIRLFLRKPKRKSTAAGSPVQSLLQSCLTMPC